MYCLCTLLLAIMACVYCRYAFSSAAWSGNQTILDKVKSFFPKLPPVPAYMNGVLPKFSQVGPSLKEGAHPRRNECMCG